jgi:hypothetical protein
MKETAILFLAAASSLAQTSARIPVEGPVTGWVWDARPAALRPILGIPGASVLGDPMDTGIVFSAAVSDQRRYAIGISSEDGQAYLLRLRGEPQTALLKGVPAGASRVVLSPGGDTAVFAYASSGKLAVVTGLPDEPSETREIDLSGTPSALAVNDHANYIAAAFENSLLIIDRDGNRWNPGLDGAPHSLTFLDGSNDLLIAGDSGVSLLRDVRNPEQTLLTGQPSRAVAATRDGAWIVLFTSGGKLRTINMATHGSREVPVPVEPSSLLRLSHSVFRINDSGNGPLWLLDLEGAEPRTVFVPADPNPAEP